MPRRDKASRMVTNRLRCCFQLKNVARDGIDAIETAAHVAPAVSYHPMSRGECSMAKRKAKKKKAKKRK